MLQKRYRSQTVRDALAQVRAELGPNAMVLSTQLVSEHGWRGWLGHRVVEVTATAESDVSETRAVEPPLRAVANPGSGKPAQPRAASTDETARPGDIEGLVAKLQAVGLGRRLASDVAHAIPASARRHVPADLLRRAVADAVQSLTVVSESFATAEVFIGPPGVGKTTTIAKIAAQERAHRGLRLGLIAADGFRVGAVDQLRLYAEILETPFAVARSVAELATAIASVKAGSVLVDTAGRNPREPEAQALMTFLGEHPQVRTHLVVSASTHPRDAARLLDACQPARPSRVVLTRLDETDSVGPLIEIVRAQQLPVSYLSYGQRVPEDLSRATPVALAAHVLGEGLDDPGDDA